MKMENNKDMGSDKRKEIYDLIIALANSYKPLVETAQICERGFIVNCDQNTIDSIAYDLEFSKGYNYKEISYDGVNVTVTKNGTEFLFTPLYGKNKPKLELLLNYSVVRAIASKTSTKFPPICFEEKNCKGRSVAEQKLYLINEFSVMDCNIYNNVRDMQLSLLNALKQ